MTRRSLIVGLVALVLAVAAGTGLYVRAASAITPGVIIVAGDVRIDEYVVKAPAITTPTPDFTVGIPSTATAGARKPGAPAAARGASRLPVVSGFLTHVLVGQGGHVSKGQVIAQLDTTLLDLGVSQARTAQVRAVSGLAVLDDNLDKLATARGKLVTARSKLLTARAQLLKAHGSLEGTIAVLQTQRASLVASITAIERLIARPGPQPPFNPPLAVVLQALQHALAGLDKGLAGARTGLAKMNAGLATMKVGLAKIQQGFAQLDTARTQLENARRLLVINIESQKVGVELAIARRSAATITAPVDGVVTFAAGAGTAVMVGAPIVRIRPDGPAHVVTYLTSDQLVQAGVGSHATVDFDSNPGRALTGRVSAVGDEADVPPTAFPTPIVHMTRAVRVTIQLDAGQTAPPGTPVDVEIDIGSGR